VLGRLGCLLVLGGIGLLGLVGLAGEHNEAGLVLLQALDVDSEALLGQVLAPVVDRNADGRSVELRNAGGLVFLGSQNPIVHISFTPPRPVKLDPFHTFSSASVKPRPRRVRRLYLIVLQCHD
jgi:hypothetical protein